MTTCILYILSDIGALSTPVPSIIFKMVKLKYLTLWGTSVNDDSDSESGKTFRYQGYSRDFTFGQFPVVTQSTTTLVPNLEPFGTKGT